MDRNDKDFIDWLLSLWKHKQVTDLENRKIAQKRKELEVFIKSSDQQVQLYDKQLKILDLQTKILNRTYKVYVILAIIALINLVLLGLDVYFKYYR